MNYKFLIAAITIISLFTLAIGCKEAKTEIDNAPLIDQWRLVQISGGIEGKTTNPDAYNTTILEFTKEGNYIETKNGQTQRQGKYSVSKGQSIYTHQRASLIKFEGSSTVSSFNFNTKRDSLYLNDEVYDGFTYSYVRQ